MAPFFVCVSVSCFDFVVFSCRRIHVPPSPVQCTAAWIGFIQIHSFVVTAVVPVEAGKLQTTAVEQSRTLFTQQYSSTATQQSVVSLCVGVRQHVCCCLHVYRVLGISCPLLLWEMFYIADNSSIMYSSIHIHTYYIPSKYYIYCCTDYTAVLLYVLLYHIWPLH